MKKTGIKLLLLVALSSFAFGGIYDDHYSVVKDAPKKHNDNTFMNGDFKEIVHFEPLHFDGDEMDDEAQDRVEKITKKINSYLEKQEKIKVVLIGFTSEATDDMNEQTIDSDTYANAIQNIFRSSEDLNSTLARSEQYAKDVRDTFVGKKLDKSLFIVEYRGGKDPAYTDESSYAKDLSNRVEVTIYVINFDGLDSDEDGVLDTHDKCRKTPKGSIVDKFGCSVFNSKDGLVHFKANSAKILAKYEPAINKLVDYLQKNKMYKVVIIGYTDNVGPKAFNMKLSMKRAISGKKALVERGVEASRIATRGYGDLNPIKSNDTEAGREANRRIEVKLFV